MDSFISTGAGSGSGAGPTSVSVPAVDTRSFTVVCPRPNPTPVVSTVDPTVGAPAGSVPAPAPARAAPLVPVPPVAPSPVPSAVTGTSVGAGARLAARAGAGTRVGAVPQPPRDRCHEEAEVDDGYDSDDTVACPYPPTQYTDRQGVGRPVAGLFRNDHEHMDEYEYDDSFRDDFWYDHEDEDDGDNDSDSDDDGDSVAETVVGTHPIIRSRCGAGAPAGGCDATGSDSSDSSGSGGCGSGAGAGGGAGSGGGGGFVDHDNDDDDDDDDDAKTVVGTDPPPVWEDYSGFVVVAVPPGLSGVYEVRLQRRVYTDGPGPRVRLLFRFVRPADQVPYQWSVLDYEEDWCFTPNTVRGLSNDFTPIPPLHILSVVIIKLDDLNLGLLPFPHR